MRKWVAGSLWVGVGLCGTGFTPIACVTHACTMMGCSDSEELRFTVDVVQVADTDVSACRNARCWHGRIAARDLTTITSHRVMNLQADDGSNSTLEYTIDTPLPAGTARFSFFWSLWGATANTPAAAGDVVRATFSDASGDVVLSEQGAISSFEEFYPNGKDCDKVGCRRGAVEGSVE